MTEKLILDSEIRRMGDRNYYLPIPIKYINKGILSLDKMYRVRFEETNNINSEKENEPISENQIAQGASR
jgi:hypothetical protein